MNNNFTPLDVLQCDMNPLKRIGDAILPAWVSQKLNCNPIPLLEECVTRGYLEKRNHSHDLIPGHPTYNITAKGYELLNQE